MYTDMVYTPGCVYSGSIATPDSGGFMRKAVFLVLDTIDFQEYIILLEGSIYKKILHQQRTIL